MQYRWRWLCTKTSCNEPLLSWRVRARLITSEKWKKKRRENKNCNWNPKTRADNKRVQSAVSLFSPWRSLCTKEMSTGWKEQPWIVCDTVVDLFYHRKHWRTWASDKTQSSTVVRPQANAYQSTSNQIDRVYVSKPFHQQRLSEANTGHLCVWSRYRKRRGKSRVFLILLMIYAKQIPVDKPSVFEDQPNHVSDHQKVMANSYHDRNIPNNSANHMRRTYRGISHYQNVMSCERWSDTKKMGKIMCDYQKKLNKLYKMFFF